MEQGNYGDGGPSGLNLPGDSRGLSGLPNPTPDLVTQQTIFGAMFARLAQAQNLGGGVSVAATTRSSSATSSQNMGSGGL